MSPSGPKVVPLTPYNSCFNFEVSLSSLPCYFVEVTTQNGSQYAIQSYGDEATELYDEVMKITGNLPMLAGRTKKFNVIPLL